MGKKNIKPSINQPVIRNITNVAKPALEGLMEENLMTTTVGVAASGGRGIPRGLPGACSYDGDDAE